MISEEAHIGPSANSTDVDGHRDRRSVSSPPATNPDNTGSYRVESPNADVSMDRSVEREFQLQRRLFELERRKIELDIEIAQRDLALARGQSRPERGHCPEVAEPYGQGAMAVAARVSGVVGSQHTATAGQGQSWRSSVRFENPGTTSLQREATLATDEQPGISRASADEHLDAEYVRWRRSVDARYGASHTSEMEHSGAMPPDDIGVGTFNGGTPYRSSGITSSLYRDNFPATSLGRTTCSGRFATNRDLPAFFGDARHWPLFIASLERSTAVWGYSDEENLLRLQKALRGQALEAVEHLLLLPEGLKEAIETLRTRFGRPDLIVDALVEKVRGLPAPRMEKLDTLVAYGTAVKNLCATIRISGLKEYQCNVTLMKELTARLPPAIRLDWARHKQRTSNATLIEFGSWLGELADAASGELSPSTRNPPTHGGDAHRQPARRATWLNTHTDRPLEDTFVCSACDGTCSTLIDCERFRDLDLGERRSIVKAAGLCRNCLRTHKGVCRARSCGVRGCSGNHHRLLHDADDEGPVRSNTTQRNDTTATDTGLGRRTHGRTWNDSTPDTRTRNRFGTRPNTTRNCYTHSGPGGVLLRYVQVVLRGQGTSITTFALLDDGSASTFMDHELMGELGLSGTPRPICLSWTGDTVREEADSVEVDMEISGAHDTAVVHKLPKVHTVRSLSLPAQTMSMEWLAERYDHLRGVPASSYTDAIPRILIGMEHCHLFRPLKWKEGKKGDPVASKTRLGWTVFGPVPRSTVAPVASHACFTSRSEEMSGHELDAALKEHFSLESIGITRPTRPLLSAYEERADELLRTRTRLLNRRYQTGLLWKTDNTNLPSSREMALRRHDCLKKKLKRDTELATAMIKKMKEYEAKGYIRRLTANEQRKKGPRDWYLPIFPVINPNKPSKIRIVFDAAAKAHGTSLNDHLLAGPDRLASLVSVLRKFREGRVAVAGDIREMFFQVKMRPEDQQSQRFFWLSGEDLEAETCTFVVAVMTFGAACSPSSAQYVKNVNAERFAERFPRAADCIKDEHYVDDMLASVETEEEALTLARDVRHIHAEGGFEIRNWVSNSKRVVRQLRQDTGDELFVEMRSDAPAEKVLGLWWNTTKDIFTFRVSPRHDKELLSGLRAPTKRELLRILMTVYDPLGLIGHHLMGLKIILQDAWRNGRQWDEALDGEVLNRWLVWAARLSSLQDVSIPRCYRTVLPTGTKAQLHVFCDAGEGGMAAVAYFRFDDNQQIECALVGSKTKVAPLKPTSVPRLELQAAVIGSRFAQHILETHRIQVSKRVFWTDSRNVVCWLRSDHRRYTPFVAFRIGEILESTSVNEWRWISTNDNVADEGTKWQKASGMTPSSRWFRGPNFLWEAEEKWPESTTDQGATSEELRRCGLHHVTPKDELVITFSRFSSWRTLLRTAGFVIRFLNKARRRIQEEYADEPSLSHDELAKAERLIFRLIQREAFPSEVKQLRDVSSSPGAWQQTVSKNSPLYRLTPEVDEHGVVRIRGRLGNCLMVDDALRRPVILPRRHHATALLISDYHERYCHINHRTVVNEIRSKYYIPKLLVELNRIRRSCQLCRIWNATPSPPLMGNIPRQRVAVHQRPFTYCGVDYFGPMNVVVGRRTEKRWGVIFTCLTVRAVHLEVAHTLTTASCIMAIRRFIASRGSPSEIISDRGTNFVGASRELSAAFTSPTLKWSFNPPGAPHFGGCWERLVRSVKTALSRMNLPRVPNDETLFTTLKEVELILNSRPLTYMPIDDEDASPITPNHILLGSSNGDKPPTQLDGSASAVRSSWKAAQHNADQFWTLWVKDYLPTLTRRTKWFQPARPIEVGDVVILVDSNAPRNCWQKGRVLTVTRAKDGQVRSASIRTVTGVYERPATKIAVIDVGIGTAKSEN